MPSLAHVIFGHLLLHDVTFVFQTFPDDARADFRPQRIRQIVVSVARKANLSETATKTKSLTTATQNISQTQMLNNSNEKVHINESEQP